MPEGVCIMRAHTDILDDRHYRSIGPLGVVARIVDFLFGLIYTLLIVRLVLELVNATRDNGFFVLIRQLSAPFFAPFRGIVGTSTLDGTHRIVWALVVAIIVYMIAHALIRGLLRLLVPG
jgi:uncharacterized protein YggT (Ycf19 family)